MGNVFLGWPNRAAETGVTIASSNNWSTRLPVSNTLTSDRGLVGRSKEDGAGFTNIRINFGHSNYTIRAVSLHSHNLSSAATVDVVIRDVISGPDLYREDGISIYGITYNDDTDKFLTGARTDWMHFITSPVAGKYVFLDVHDTANPDTFIEVGMMGAWSGFSPAFNMSYGENATFEDQSRRSYGYSGALNFEKRIPKRIRRFALENLTLAERDQLYSFMLQADTTDDILFMPNTTDADENERYGFLANLKRLQSFERRSAVESAIEFELLERL